MGQGSSLDVPSPGPTVGNLMVDASDSFVTELKLRSTGIIPISEYIKKEKYRKNVQRLEEVKKVEQSDHSHSQSEVDTKDSTKDSKHAEQDEKSQPNEEVRSRRRKKGSDFVETSYEDVPDRRVWVIKPSGHRPSVKKPQDCSTTQSTVVYREPENCSDHLIIPQKTKHTKNRVHTPHHTTHAVEKHIKTRDAPPEVEPEVEQEVKPEVRHNKAPELMELYHRKHREEYRKPKRTKHKNVKTSSTDLVKFRHRNDKDIRDKNNNTQSTHNVKHHHFNIFPVQHQNRNDIPMLSVQTNLSCTIPPNRYLIPCLKQSSSNIYVHPMHNAKILKNEKKTSRSVNKVLRFVTPPKSVEKIEIATSSMSLTPEDSYTLNMRKYDTKKRFSARQALESWKNIHVQKYRERNRTRSPSPAKRTQEIAEPLEDVYNNYSNDTSRESDEIPILKSNRPSSRNYPKTIRRYLKNSSTIFHRSPQTDKCLQTEGSIRPSKEFLDDIERCLQRHSHLSDLYIKRNGGAKSTWVQDKYRRWHKITFEDN